MSRATRVKFAGFQGRIYERHGAVGVTAHAPAWRPCHGWLPRSPTQPDIGLLGELGERGEFGREREASSQEAGEREAPHEAIPLHGRAGGGGVKLGRARGDSVGPSVLPGLRSAQDCGYLSGRTVVPGR